VCVVYEQKTFVELAIIRELVCLAVRLSTSFQTKVPSSEIVYKLSVLVSLKNNNIVIWLLVSSRIHIQMGFHQIPTTY